MNTNMKNQFDNLTYNRRRGYLKNDVYSRGFNERGNPSAVRITETDSSYHFELKIPGYIKDDFNFYIIKDELVITTEKSKRVSINKTLDNKVRKHLYCYPSAYFRKTIALPNDIVRNKIFVDYKNETLSFHLIKKE